MPAVRHRARAAFLRDEGRGTKLADKTLRAVVPVAAGSSTDIVPRVVFEQLSSQLTQPIVVENRTGAGGTIGTAFVAKSDPDGYTILASGSAHTIAPSLYSKLNYHPARDFVAVVPLGISPNVLVVSPARRFKTVGDLVAAGKAKARALSFSSVGVGTATHLSAERFRFSAGIEAVHVPFRGGAEAMSEVIAGRVDFFFGPPALVLPACPRGQTCSAGGQWHQPHGGIAGCPNHSRGRFWRRRIPDLVRAFPSGKDTAQHRRQAAPRDAQSSASTEGARSVGCPRHRANGHDAECFQRVCRKGHCRQRSACPSGRYQAG